MWEQPVGRGCATLSWPLEIRVKHRNPKKKNIFKDGARDPRGREEGVSIGSSGRAIPNSWKGKV